MVEWICAERQFVSCLSVCEWYTKFGNGSFGSNGSAFVIARLIPVSSRLYTECCLVVSCRGLLCGIWHDVRKRVDFLFGSTWEALFFITPVIASNFSWTKIKGFHFFRFASEADSTVSYFVCLTLDLFEPCCKLASNNFHPCFPFYDLDEKTFSCIISHHTLSFDLSTPFPFVFQFICFPLCLSIVIIFLTARTHSSLILVFHIGSLMETLLSFPPLVGLISFYCLLSHEVDSFFHK